MKYLTVLCLLLFSSPVFAGDEAIEQYIDALVSMKQTEVSRLEQAIQLLHNNNLSGQELFERIGEPGFSAVDQALASHGYTLRQLYQFAEDNSVAISQWLQEHTNKAKEIEALNSAEKSLLREYDHLAGSTAATTANQGEKE